MRHQPDRAGASYAHGRRFELCPDHHLNWRVGRAVRQRGANASSPSGRTGSIPVLSAITRRRWAIPSRSIYDGQRWPNAAAARSLSIAAAPFLRAWRSGLRACLPNRRCSVRSRPPAPTCHRLVLRVRRFQRWTSRVELPLAGPNWWAKFLGASPSWLEPRSDGIGTGL